MTTHSRLWTLCGKIDDLQAEILDTKKALSAAQEPADIAFLRKRLGDLDKKEILLVEQHNRLQDQTSGAIIDMPAEQEVTVQIEDGTKYPATLFGGRLDIGILQEQMAQDGLTLTKLGGKLPTAVAMD